MTLTPMSAAKALDQYFLEARARLLDLAAILDRIGRGEERSTDDPRLARIQQAIEILHDADHNRAKRVQEVFSLKYEQEWEKSRPRTTDR